MAIPKSVRATVARQQGVRYAGTVRIGLLPRLKEALASEGEPLQVTCEVVEDEAHPAELRVDAKGQLAVTCQRCMKRFDWPLELHSRLRLVGSEAEEARVLADCDPYRVQDDQLPLHEIVEDEVLLALPMMPRCEACENELQDAPEAAPREAEPAAPNNPFAQLKKKLKSD